jgi:hypothetical protein
LVNTARQSAAKSPFLRICFVAVLCAFALTACISGNAQDQHEQATREATKGNKLEEIQETTVAERFKREDASPHPIDHHGARNQQSRPRPRRLLLRAAAEFDRQRLPVERHGLCLRRAFESSIRAKGDRGLVSD